MPLKTLTHAGKELRDLRELRIARDHEPGARRFLFRPGSAPRPAPGRLARSERAVAGERVSSTSAARCPTKLESPIGSGA